ISDASPHRYIALLKFRQSSHVDEFIAEYHGRPFSVLEPEICQAVRVASVQLVASANPSQVNKPPSLTWEWDRREDAGGEGHDAVGAGDGGDGGAWGTYHGGAGALARVAHLSRMPRANGLACHWPRHRGMPSHLPLSLLKPVGRWTRVPVCMVSYVHRLIQNKVDGKLVELPDDMAGGHAHSGEYAAQHSTASTSYLPSQSKIDMLTSEYTHLLTAQLDSQRQHYEVELNAAYGKIGDLQMELERVSSKAAEVDAVERENHALQQSMEALQKEKAHLEKRSDKLEKRLHMLERLWEEERQMSEGMRANQEAAQQAAAERDKEIADLREQVRDLMFFMTARDKIERGELGDEVKEGSVQAIANQPGDSSGGGGAAVIVRDGAVDVNDNKVAMYHLCIYCASIAANLAVYSKMVDEEDHRLMPQCTSSNGEHVRHPACYRAISFVDGVL
ncbi:hypothetical protein SYNPS1DRAFT_31917, partial [Syncephalis pseudoplumigaleata]